MNVLELIWQKKTTFVFCPSIVTTRLFPWFRKNRRNCRVFPIDCPYDWQWVRCGRNCERLPMSKTNVRNLMHWRWIPCCCFFSVINTDSCANNIYLAGMVAELNIIIYVHLWCTPTTIKSNLQPTVYSPLWDFILKLNEHVTTKIVFCIIL